MQIQNELYREVYGESFAPGSCSFNVDLKFHTVYHWTKDESFDKDKTAVDQ